MKAAWRILTDADTPAIRARYYVVRDARVTDVAASLDAGRVVCAQRDGVTHRLTNPGKINLELIEVQTGSYLGEDDIVRIEDVYDRVGK